MRVIAAYIYSDGRRVREASLTDEGLALAPGEFVWIGLLEPDESELRGLQKRFNLHPLAVEDALTAHQMPKVEVYGAVSGGHGRRGKRVPRHERPLGLDLRSARRPRSSQASAMASQREFRS